MKQFAQFWLREIHFQTPPRLVTSLSLSVRKLTRYTLIPSAVRQRLVLCSHSVHSLFLQCSRRNASCLFIHLSKASLNYVSVQVKRSDPAHLKVLPQPDWPLATLMPSSSIVAVNKEVKIALDSSVEHKTDEISGKNQRRTHLVHFFVAAKPLADRSIPYVLVNVIPSDFELNNVDRHLRSQPFS